MNQPRLRFKEFKGELDRKFLKDIVKVTMGQSPDSNNYTSNPKFPILVQGNADLSNGHVIPRVYTKHVNKKIYLNDTILTVRAPVGEVAINQFDEVAIGRGVAGISKNIFIFIYFQYLYMSNYWKKITTGSTFESINSNDIKYLNVTIPSHKIEQQKIGQFFQNLDQQIELQSGKLEHLKQSKQGYLQKMFPNVDNYILIPILRFYGFHNNWQYEKLGNIGNTFTGLSGKNKEDFGHGDARYVPYMNVHDNPIVDDSDVDKIEIDKKQNELKYGDILFTTSSETPEEVGLSSIWLYNKSNVYLNSFAPMMII